MTVDERLERAAAHVDRWREAAEVEHGRVLAMQQALAPFARLARGIPGNWPGRCVLRMDERSDGSLYLSYLKEGAEPDMPTIDDWRKLTELSGPFTEIN